MISAFSGVLVVEDELSLRQILVHLLRRWGCPRVEEADNGEEAVEKFRRGNHNLILMDLHMPRMDGFHASKTIMGINPQTAIVLVTGDPEHPLAKKAAEEGYVKAVASKPLCFHGLETTIRNLAPSTPVVENGCSTEAAAL